MQYKRQSQSIAPKSYSIPDENYNLNIIVVLRTVAQMEAILLHFFLYCIYCAFVSSLTLVHRRMSKMK